MKHGNSALRRAGVSLLAGLVALVGFAVIATPVGAAAGFSFHRYAGANRFDTARLIAIDTYGTAPTVLMARGDLFPDALAGNYLAGSTGQGAPMLLTRSDSLPAETDDALRTLGTNRVIILGGPDAVNSSVESQLRGRGLQVEREFGQDRFETAQAVAQRPGPGNVGSIDGARTAIVASGRNFPDALAGGPLAYASKLPTLLTDTNSLPAPARNGLTNLAIRHVLLLGGTAAVSNAVEDQIKNMGITVTRLAGVDRQDTATKIATYAMQKLGFGNTHVNLARGDGFADALSGGPHAGKDKAYILLTGNPTTLTATTRDFLNSQASTLTTGHIFGGTAAISTQVEQEATSAALSGRAIVSVNPTSVAQAGQVKGTVTGQNIQSVSVSGCGLAQQNVQRDASGAFTLQLPSSQAPGSCTLTFVTTFTDGTSETDTVAMTITPIARAVTAAPELLLVTFVRTVTSPASNPTQTFEQSTYRFTFDEPIVGQNPMANRFVLYRYDRIGNFNTPPSYTGRTAQIDPDDNRSALVVFGAEPTTAQANATNRPVGAAQVAQITTGAVQPDAVRDNGGQPNPEGDAPTRDVTFSPGRTTAPDLVSVGSFRPTFDLTRTLVDFTFDQPAWVCSAGPTAAGACQANPTVQNPTLTPYAMVLSTPEADERRCFFVPEPPGTVSRGNGTTVHTVSCAPLTPGVQLTASNVARGTIDAGAVAATADPPAPPGPSPTDRNPLQAADVNAGGVTDRPDLVSVTFQPDVSASPDATSFVDRVIFTFDEAVFLEVPGTPDATPACLDNNDRPASCYVVYRFDGTETGGRTTPSSGNNAFPGTPQRSATNANEVFVDFPTGTLVDATGASVRDGAAREAVATGGVNRRNEQDEVDAQARTIPGGRTNGPDLIACRTEGSSFDPVTGAPLSFRLVFTFDEEVAATNPSAQNFHVYDANGVLVPQASGTHVASRSTTNRTEMVVPANAYAGTSLRSGVACGVPEGTEGFVGANPVVRDDPADPSKRATNPIGYEGLLQAAGG